MEIFSPRIFYWIRTVYIFWHVRISTVLTPRSTASFLGKSGDMFCTREHNRSYLLTFCKSMKFMQKILQCLLHQHMWNPPLWGVFIKCDSESFQISILAMNVNMPFVVVVACLSPRSLVLRSTHSFLMKFSNLLFIKCLFIIKLIFLNHLRAS